MVHMITASQKKKKSANKPGKKAKKTSSTVVTGSPIINNNDIAVDANASGTAENPGPTDQEKIAAVNAWLGGDGNATADGRSQNGATRAARRRGNNSRTRTSNRGHCLSCLVEVLCCCIIGLITGGKN